jgi:hypothetical protein
MSKHKQEPVRTGHVFLLLSAVALMFLKIPTAMAQENDDTKFSISLGVFLTDRNNTTRVDGTAGMDDGTVVDLEGDLGLDRSDSVFRIDGYYRFNQKHRLDFSAFDLSRTASKDIEEDIEWNDTVFPIDTTVSSDFDLAIYKLAYTWSFMRRDKGFLGLTAGLYIADFGMRLEAEAISELESNSLTAPLPVFGLRGQYDFTEKLTFRASAEIFALEYDDYSGSLYDIYAGLDYQFFKHVAIGIGINAVELNVEINKDNLDADIDWRYDGGLVFFKFDF